MKKSKGIIFTIVTITIVITICIVAFMVKNKPEANNDNADKTGIVAAPE